MAKHETKVDPSQMEVEAPEGDVSSVDPATGIRSRKAIMLREFLPSKEWMALNINSKEKGTKTMLGAVYGIVTGTEIRTGRLPDGTEKPSIVCKGMFESLNHLTGEISRASSVYFPEAFAEEIKAMFIADEELKTVKVDTDIGVEATGKTIPYTWIVIQFVEPAQRNILQALRMERIRTKPNPLQLTHSK